VLCETGHEAAGSASAASVRARDHFQAMAVGVGEIDPAAAIVVIDLAGSAAHRIGPMVETSLADAAENSVEIRLADQEGLVLWSDRAVGVGEIE
jgi:hypothetical protein